MTLGFLRAAPGAEVVAAFDSDPRRVISYRLNFPWVKCWCVDALSLEDFPEVDVVLIHPPSRLARFGLSVKYWRYVEMTGGKDTDGPLLCHVARVLRDSGVRLVIMQLHPMVRKQVSGEVFRQIVECLRGELGLVSEWEVLDSRFWVPQARRRLYLVAAREFVEPMEWPVMDGHVHTYREVRQRYDVARYHMLNERQLRDGLRASGALGRQRLHVISEWDVPETLLGRYWREPWPMCVDEGWERPRRLTLLELRRICGFPDDWALVGTFAENTRALSEAAHPPLIADIARRALRASGLVRVAVGDG